MQIQIEDGKANHARVSEEISKLQEERVDLVEKLEDLAGKPEKLQKQVTFCCMFQEASRPEFESIKQLRYDKKMIDLSMLRFFLLFVTRPASDEHSHWLIKCDINVKCTADVG